MAARRSAARPRLLAMDGLRLLCALAVAGYHYGVAWRIDGVHPPAYHLPTASHVLIYGFLGVELFFMISGFVICMSSWGRGLGEFFTSRVVRVYPAFWISCLITAVVIAVLPVTVGVPVATKLTPPDIAVNMTMLAEPLSTPLVDTVYWTLWVELRFYLLFALLSWRGLTYRRVTAFCILWMTAAILTPSLDSKLIDTLVMPTWAPYFVAGVAMYLMHRYRPNALLWAIVGFCWLVSLQRVQVRIADVHPGFSVPGWPALLIITVAYGVMLAIALGRTSRITWRWLGTAGCLTYPFYLLHQRIGYSVIRAVHDRAALPASVLIIGTMAAVLALAWLVHRFVERPLAPVLRSALRRALAEIRTSPVGDGAAGTGTVAGADRPTVPSPRPHALAGRQEGGSPSADQTGDRSEGVAYQASGAASPQ
ncbi:acyltransferase family protein [Krasilnikovia sp. MM14-A1004]|uniref:acyltransferase family protein n=1 Tax=Krasilnikovia sp. MM14-A1004 TaxID=3373541 RepID=UPI00399CF54A